MAYGKPQYKSHSYDNGADYNSVAYPTRSVGDILILCVVHKCVSGGWESIITPSGFTPMAGNYVLRNGLGTDGVNDQGMVETTMFYRIVTGTEFGVVVVDTLNAFATTSMQSILICYTKPPDSEWINVKAGSGADIITIIPPPPTTVYTSFGVIISADDDSNPPPTNNFTFYSNDLVIALSGINSDVFTFSNPTLAQSGSSTESEGILEQVPDSTGTAQTIIVSHHRITYGNENANNISYQLIPNANCTTYTPTGTVVMGILRVRPWKKLKRKSGTSWIWSTLKHYYSSNWRLADNAAGTGKLLKRKTASGWEGVSTFNFSVNEDALTFTWNGTGQVKAITSGHEVNISTVESWIILSLKTIHGSNNLTIGVTEQAGGAPTRNGYVSLKIDGVEYASIYVSQNAGPTPTIDLDYIQLTWDNNGNPCNSGVLTVTANCDWYINELTIPAWLTLNQNSGLTGVTQISMTVGYGSETYKEGILDFYSVIDDINRNSLQVRQLEGDCV